jgi:hypothetical protein|eukprot:5630725-Prymnesium_polylepis.2
MCNEVWPTACSGAALALVHGHPSRSSLRATHILKPFGYTRKSRRLLRHCINFALTSSPSDPALANLLDAKAEQCNVTATVLCDKEGHHEGLTARVA